MIYLDNSATTRASDATVRATLQGMQEDFFNPASLYAPAVNVNRRIQDVRSKIARSLGANAEEIIFTSGGTESDHIAIMGTLGALRPGPWRFITSSIEHQAILRTFDSVQQAGHEVVLIKCDDKGYLDLDHLAAMVDERTAFVSIMHVNNEFGSIQDLHAISQIVRRGSPYAVFHSDGVQAYGKLSFHPVPVDAYSISAHKFHGPKGIGALMLRRNIKNVGGQRGGGQERGLRSGTLNGSGIMGMGAAVEELLNNQARDIANMRDCKNRLASNLMQLPDILINGPSVEMGAPHILNVSIMGIRGEVMLHALEERQIYVGTGSACSSRKKEPNRILAAIGITGNRAECAIRFSLSPYNTPEEMDITAQAINELIGPLRKYRRR